MSQGNLTEGLAASQMRTAAYCFIFAAIATAALDFINLFLFVPYLAIISSVLLGVAIVFLGLSMKKIATLSTGLSRNADTAGGWLITYVVLIVVRSIMSIFPLLDIYVGIVALIALVTKIGGFMKVNKTFNQMSMSPQSRIRLDSPIFPFYGWYEVIIVIVLFATAFSWNFTAIFAVSITGMVAGILLLLAIGIKLLSNSRYVQEYSVSKEMIQLSPIYAPTQPITPPVAQPQQQVAFCSHCGAKINPTDKFCENCGAEI